MIPVLSVLLGAASAQVRAEDLPVAERDARAREIYENGMTLYREGLYEDAIAAFQEAYRLSGLHEVLLNIANAYERLGRYGEAVAVLNRYRAFARPDEREQIRTRIAENTRRHASAQPDAPVQPLPIPPLRPPVTRVDGPTDEARPSPGSD